MIEQLLSLSCMSCRIQSDIPRPTTLRASGSATWPQSDCPGGVRIGAPGLLLRSDEDHHPVGLALTANPAVPAGDLAPPAPRGGCRRAGLPRRAMGAQISYTSVATAKGNRVSPEDAGAAGRGKENGERRGRPSTDAGSLALPLASRARSPQRNVLGLKLWGSPLAVDSARAGSPDAHLRRHGTFEDSATFQEGSKEFFGRSTAAEWVSRLPAVDDAPNHRGSLAVSSHRTFGWPLGTSMLFSHSQPKFVRTQGGNDGSSLVWSAMPVTEEAEAKQARPASRGRGHKHRKASIERLNLMHGET